MNDTPDIEILPEDKVELTNDEKNLVELAFAKQLPPEDAEFLEKVHKDTKTITDPYSEINRYLSTKYGVEFGRIYLAAITGGEEEYKEAVTEVEKRRALDRIKRESQN